MKDLIIKEMSEFGNMPANDMPDYEKEKNERWRKICEGIDTAGKSMEVPADAITEVEPDGGEEAKIICYDLVCDNCDHYKDIPGGGTRCALDWLHCINNSYKNWKAAGSEYVNGGAEIEPRADALVTIEYLAKIEKNLDKISSRQYRTYLAVHNQSMTATNQLAVSKTLTFLNKVAILLGAGLFTLHHIILRWG